VSSSVGLGAGAAPRTPYALASRRLLRDTVFDATRDELRLRTWADITMADIARLAGVSRQTLYKEFGSRDEFAQAFVIREGERFLEAVELALRSHLDDPRTAVATAFDVFLTTAGEDPFVRLLLSDDGTGGMLPLVTTQGKPVVEWASERLTNIVVSSWPAVKLADVQPLAECLVRLAISYVTLPKGSTSVTAASVVTLLGPYVERVIVSSDES
jgi:AcrR family transcriptional regulator